MIVVLVLATTSLTYGSSAAAAKDAPLNKPINVVMGTASAVGGWYVLGGGVCQVIQKHIPGLTATPQVTGGSIENVRLLANKEVELIMVGAGTAIAALRGDKPFTERYEGLMNGLFTFGATAVHLVVRSGSNFNSLNDLKGKKVAIGPPGSGTENVSRKILAAAGLDKSIKAMPMGFNDMYDALKDGNVDAFVLEASPPGPALEELARTSGIKLIRLDDNLLDQIVTGDKAYYKGAIVAGTYSGVEYDVPTLFSASFVACRPDFPEEAAYRITKAVFENIPELIQVHASAKAIKLEGALYGIPVPVHPGAMKYYSEVKGQK